MPLFLLAKLLVQRGLVVRLHEEMPLAQLQSLPLHFERLRESLVSRFFPQLVSPLAVQYLRVHF